MGGTLAACSPTSARSLVASCPHSIPPLPTRWPSTSAPEGPRSPSSPPTATSPPTASPRSTCCSARAARRSSGPPNGGTRSAARPARRWPTAASHPRTSSVSPAPPVVGTVAVGADGAAVCDALIWLDSRGASDVRALLGGPVSAMGYDVTKLARWVRLTGGVPSLSGKDPIGHIAICATTAPTSITRPRSLGAGRLPEPAPDRPGARLVRLDHRPLGHRQP